MITLGVGLILIRESIPDGATTSTAKPSNLSLLIIAYHKNIFHVPHDHEQRPTFVIC
jgi:hypothetical protein